MAKARRCTRRKRVYSAALGGYTKRCASYSGTSRKRSTRRKGVGGLSIRKTSAGKSACKRICASWQKVDGGPVRCKKFRKPTRSECNLMRNRDSGQSSPAHGSRKKLAAKTTTTARSRRRQAIATGLTAKERKALDFHAKRMVTRKQGSRTICVSLKTRKQVKCPKVVKKAQKLRKSA